MIQANSGIVYIANQAGLLEYDGVTWRVIKVPGYDPVRSLAVDKSGIIYIGGRGKIGYLKPGDLGNLKYISLMDKLQEEQKNFSTVWRTHVIGDEVYFCPSQKILRWNPRTENVAVLDTEHGFDYSFKVVNRLLVQQKNMGLMEVVGGSLKPVQSNIDETIVMILPMNSVNGNGQCLLIGTQSKGLFVFNGKTSEAFPTAADAILKKNRLSYGIRLSSGDLALATRLGGVVVLDSHQRIKRILDSTSGIQDDDVKYLFEDREGNLWLCLEKGISKIEYGSPFSFYDNSFSLPGIVLSVVSFQQTLYVGTTRGLFVYVHGDFSFHPVPGITGGCWSLLTLEDSILAATTLGTFQVDSNRKISQVNLGMSFTLTKSRKKPGITWCGMRGGVAALYREKGKWKEKRYLQTIQEDIRSLVEDAKGDLWFGTSNGDIFRLSIAGRDTQSLVKRYQSSHGLPTGEIFAFFAAGHVVFATNQGIYRFDEFQETFYPDKTLGGDFAGGDKSKAVFRIVEDIDRNLWFHSASRNYLALPGQRNCHEIYKKPFLRLPVAQVNVIYPDPVEECIWFGGIEGLTCYDLTVKKNYDLSFGTLIRKVDAKSDESIYTMLEKRETKSTSAPILTEIEYKYRDLQFEFAAPFFEAESDTEYRCILEGYKKEWSSWSKDRKRDYTNLSPGVYTFRVQAKNVYGTLSGEDTFRFKVLPPWYRLWWAYIIYGGIFFFLMFLGIKWRSRILVQEKRKLEQTIKARTREVWDKNRQLEAQTQKLSKQSEKLQEMDQIKSRFFANISHEFRTPLTLIMGPLEQINDDSRYRDLHDKTKVMLRSSRRLSRLIEQLLDLSRLDSGKMRLRASKQDIVSFLRGLIASFEWMAEQKKQSLVFKADRPGLSLFFDWEIMEKVFGNLLANALKFTPGGGTISISITSSPEQVEVSVKDTGIGIPAQHLSHIFDRFFQVDQEDRGDNHQRGTGIGLALTRELVTLHHGKIDVHSIEGKGTEFIILLPLGDGHLAPADIVSEAEDHTRAGFDVTELYLEEKEDETTEPADGPGRVDRYSGDGRNVVLVVEDNADMRKYIRESLQASYSVIEAADGVEGLQMARETIPDLVISDIMMPGIDGYELCKALKEDITTSHIPVIMLTAKASEESKILGLQTGADDYVTKPFSTQVLLTRVENLIDLRSQLQDLYRKKMFLSGKMSITTLDDQFLEKYRNIIKDSMTDSEFTIDILCKKIKMGRSTLFKKIKALTNETPNQHILTYRLEYAALLLKDKSRSVTDVAFEVGFSSSAYFARCFKDKFGYPPSDHQSQTTRN